MAAAFETAAFPRLNMLSHEQCERSPRFLEILRRTECGSIDEALGLRRMTRSSAMEPGALSARAGRVGAQAAPIAGGLPAGTDGGRPAEGRLVTGTVPLPHHLDPLTGQRRPLHGRSDRYIHLRMPCLTTLHVDGHPGRPWSANAIASSSR
jgi:hypothetical protein